MPIFSRLPGHEGVTVPIIEARNLRKEFRVFKRREGVWGAVRDLFHRDYVTLAAVDGINLNVEEGDFLGYIGPNGAEFGRNMVNVQTARNETNNSTWRMCCQIQDLQVRSLRLIRS